MEEQAQDEVRREGEPVVGEVEVSEDEMVQSLVAGAVNITSWVAQSVRNVSRRVESSPMRSVSARS
jgi:type IV secretory pathway ATPase VirB11/archaellum biosynthesis ATPase